jgi:hypothetical protein
MSSYELIWHFTIKCAKRAKENVNEPMNTDQKIIKNKVGVLKLAEMLVARR